MFVIAPHGNVFFVPVYPFPGFVHWCSVTLHRAPYPSLYVLPVWVPSNPDFRSQFARIDNHFAWGGILRHNGLQHIYYSSPMTKGSNLIHPVNERIK